MHIKVAFLLTNLVSDLVNPDCLSVHVSWNKNLKKRLGHYDKGPGNHYFQKKDGGLSQSATCNFLTGGTPS